MGVDQVAFWNERAKLGEYAGTRDRILKRLEIEVIAKYVKDGMRVLDAGCGDGETAIELRHRFDIGIEGFDGSPKMVQLAQDNARAHDLQTRQSGNRYQWINVHNNWIFDWHVSGYDLIYTERVIINLPDWATQLRAIRHLIGLLKPGGLYVMCESCQDGLDRINRLRDRLGLSVILPPEHDRYLHWKEICEASISGLIPPPSMVDFTGTYYLLSRVVNAAIAQQEGKEPDYESPINKLALGLPPLAEGFGQTRIWVFRRPE